MRTALLGALAALLFAAPAAQADTYNVNTPADSTVCDSITCSLKGAWLNTLQNGSTTPDVINVPAGTYSVTGGLDTSQGQTPGAVTIAGRGANQTIIRQPGTTRVLTIGGGAYTVTGVTLRDGDARTSTYGGNVLITAGSLALTDVRVTAGQAYYGGGIAVNVTSTPASVTASRTLIDNNTASQINAVGGQGGGVYLHGQTGSATATLTNSTVTANQAFDGGGIYGFSTGGITLAGATVARNTANGTSAPGGVRTTSGTGRPSRARSSPATRGSVQARR